MVDPVLFVKNLWKSYCEHKETDIYVVSYPKAGRTWLLYMLKLVLQYFYDTDSHNFKYFYEKRNIPLLRMTHDGSGASKKMRSYIDIEHSNMFQYKQKKVIFESIGGLVALLFEILVGIWLLFFA